MTILTFLCLLSDFERADDVVGGVGESTDGGGRGGDEGDGAGRASAVFVGGIPDMMPRKWKFHVKYPIAHYCQ